MEKREKIYGMPGKDMETTELGDVQQERAYHEDEIKKAKEDLKWLKQKEANGETLDLADQRSLAENLREIKSNEEALQTPRLREEPNQSK